MILPKIEYLLRKIDRNNPAMIKTGQLKHHQLSSDRGAHIATKYDPYTIFKGHHPGIDQTNSDHRSG
ncbi:MAG: hypothetical protein ACI9C4_000338 [Paraglaciecola sp.]